MKLRILSRTLPLLLCIAVGLVLSIHLSPVSASTSGVVISQVYGAGGVTGSTYNNDFIELFNGGTTAVQLSGWTLQFAGAVGAFDATNTGLTTTLPAFLLQPGQYFLVQEFQTLQQESNPLPTPDYIDATPIGLGTANGKIVLASDGVTVVDPTSANVVDFVGYGTANQSEGGTPVGALSVINSAQRKLNGCTDTDNNGADFTTAAAFPNARNSATALNPCFSPTATPTHTPTNTATDTPTNTATSTATNTPTDTPTSTPTDTPTDTPTATDIPPTATDTATDVPPTATVTTEAATSTATSENPTETPIVETATSTVEGSTPTATATSESETSTPISETATATPESGTATATSDFTSTATPTETLVPEVELLKNGGMELDLTGNKLPDDWGVKNAVGERLKCNKGDKIFAHSGLCAFRFKGGANENSKLLQIPDLAGLNFKPGDQIALSVFIEATNSAVKSKVKLSVKYVSGEQEKFKVDILVNEGYTLVTGAIDLTDPLVAKVKLQFDHKSLAGKVYIDDASVKLVRPPALIPLP